MTDKKYKPIENRMKKIAMKPWRRNVLKRSTKTLVVLEFVLSVTFFVISYLTGNVYFKGVAVGLLIAWVTGGIVLLFKRQIVA
jgi:hypothetical protein